MRGFTECSPSNLYSNIIYYGSFLKICIIPNLCTWCTPNTGVANCNENIGNVQYVIYVIYNTYSITGWGHRKRLKPYNVIDMRGGDPGTGHQQKCSFFMLHSQKKKMVLHCKIYEFIKREVHYNIIS